MLRDNIKILSLKVTEIMSNSEILSRLMELNNKILHLMFKREAEIDSLMD